MKIKTFNKILFRSPSQSLDFVDKVNSNELFEEGLYLSSPELVSEKKKIDTLDPKGKAKLEKSILKYHIRSCTRCTPYATFAGSYLALASDKTDIRIGDSYRRYVRVDMNFLAQITEYLQSAPEIKEQLTYRVNNGIYPFADSYRYAEYSLFNNNRTYRLTAIEKTDLLDEIYRMSQEAISYRELHNIIVEKADVGKEDVSMFIDELISSQFLISNLEPKVTGQEPLYETIERLETLHHVDDYLVVLKEIEQKVRNPQSGITYYTEIEDKLKGLHESIQVPKNTIQVDLFHTPASSNIDKEFLEEIIKQVQSLWVFNRKMTKPDIDTFKTDFYKKYEDREIPLHHVMDADIGIGYAGNTGGGVGDHGLIENLMVGGGGNPTSSQINYDYIQGYSQKKYLEWRDSKAEYIEIKEEEIKSFESQAKVARFPESMAIMGALHGQNGQADRANFRFELYSCGGPSGANLLGRFAMGDVQVETLCREIAEKEEEHYSDYIFAEIAHLPQARIGNILLRPCIRKYEIAYIGLSGLSIDNEITIDDILVSIRQNEVVLRSKKYNKRIIPRLSTAHNYSHGSLPIYKFLCDLQAQGYSFPCVWDWGTLGSQKYLPRVVYKNIIFQKARWTVEEADIRDIPKEKSSWLDYMATFREKYKLPKRVLYSQGDNNLLIDFEKLNIVELLIDYIRKYKRVTLIEFLFTSDNCIVRDSKGNPYTNEVIIPIYKEIGVKSNEIK